MGTRAAATSLAKRTTFSSAINILPNELQANHRLDHQDDVVIDTISAAKPYSSIPGPKELPLIGNSWRFAPIIGKTYKELNPKAKTLEKNRADCMNRKKGTYHLLKSTADHFGKDLFPNTELKRSVQFKPLKSIYIRCKIYFQILLENIMILVYHHRNLDPNNHCQLCEYCRNVDISYKNHKF